MKRWVILAALAAILGTSSVASATDFPVTTQSTQSNTGRNRPLFGNGGIFFPWLNRSGYSNRMDPGLARRNAQFTGYGNRTTTPRVRRDSNVFFSTDDMFRGLRR
jgi:hypothetical protein